MMRQCVVDVRYLIVLIAIGVTSVSTLATAAENVDSRGVAATESDAASADTLFREVIGPDAVEAVRRLSWRLTARIGITPGQPESDASRGRPRSRNFAWTRSGQFIVPRNFGAPRRVE